MATSMTDSFNATTREYRVLQKQFGKLVKAISNPVPLAADLFSADLISEQTKMEVVNECCNIFVRNFRLINELMIAITLIPANFLKIVSVFQKYPPFLSHIAEEMKREYGENTIKYIKIYLANMVLANMVHF